MLEKLERRLGREPEETAVRRQVVMQLSLPIFFLGAWAQAKPQAENLVQEFEKAKVSLSQDDLKQRQILSSLFRIGHKMKKIVTEKSALVQEKMGVESSVKELAGRITELESKTKDQRALLRNRLTAIYKLGGQGLARFLFSSSNSSELERNLKILGVIAKQDMELIKDFSDMKRDLENKKFKLTQRWQRLQSLQKKIIEQEKLLAEENLAKNELLQQIRSSQKFAVKKIEFLRRKSRQISSVDDNGLLDLLFQPSFLDQKGRLPSPLEGRLVQGFGLIKGEGHKVVMSHKGHFIQAPQGTAVKAVFQGKVAFAGEIPGYGRTLILDHGDHYYSVYSHNKLLQVKEGDEVAQHQNLALSGSAGPQQGDGLYFEIRHFSEPSDPKLWMKGSIL